MSDIGSWFSLRLSHYLTKIGGEEQKEEGTQVLIKVRDCNNSPTTPFCNHFSPSPVYVPGCVDTAKRRDASYCMTNQDELIHLSMVSFLNKPIGSVCISPIQWLSNSLQLNLSPLPSIIFSSPLSFLLCHSICCVWLRVTLSGCMSLLSTNLSSSVFKESGQIPRVPIPQTLPVFGSGVAMFPGQMDPLSHIFPPEFQNSFLAMNATDRACSETVTIHLKSSFVPTFLPYVQKHPLF